MPEDEAHLLMRHRLNKIDGELDGRLPWYDILPEDKKNVLQDMSYQMGVAGVLRFKKFLAALEAGKFEHAAKEMLDSKWARTDSPGRARELAGIIRGGA
jgi:lysozyme